MNFKKSRTLMWAGLLVGIILAALGENFENKTVALCAMVVGMVIFFAALIQAFIFYRCPTCRYSLMNVKGDTPKYCPGCGEEL